MWSNKATDRLCFFFIFGVTLARVLTSRVHSCPEFFDCNSYLQMVDSLRYDPTVPGHHAMRILPSLLARMLHEGGMSLEAAFRAISGGSYILFGVLLYGILRKSLAPTLALGFSLLCLSVHHAMRIPLQLPYQACDMMTYPLTLLVIHFSLEKRILPVFLLSLVGILVKQNLLILGLLALGYCITSRETQRAKGACCAVLLVCLYSALQGYYHASGTFIALLTPPAGFFTAEHLWEIIQDSQIIHLLILGVPWFLMMGKSLWRLLWRYWHMTLYVALVVGQPFLGYHLTGNNFARLALQGIWIIYWMTALASQGEQRLYDVRMFFLAYSIYGYFIWSEPQRLGVMIVSLLFLLAVYVKKHGFGARARSDTVID